MIYKNKKVGSIIMYFSTNKLKYYDTLCKCKPRKLSLSPSFQQILQGQSMYLWANRALKTRLYRKNRMPNAYIRFLKQLKQLKDIHHYNFLPTKVVEKLGDLFYSFWHDFYEFSVLPILLYLLLYFAAHGGKFSLPFRGISWLRKKAEPINLFSGTLFLLLTHAQVNFSARPLPKYGRLTSLIGSLKILCKYISSQQKLKDWRG